MQEKIEIPLSKKKIAFLMVGALLFVLAGFSFILTPETFRSPIIPNPEMIRIAGIAAVVLFGLALVFLARKLSDTKIGLTLDARGITDNSNATSIGLILWEDITNISTLQISSSKILLIETDKPEKYIDKAKNGLVRRIMKTNYTSYGTPLSIISGSLKIKFEDLEKLVIDQFEKRKY